MKDRDLLFGTLAIKKGYISTDEITACIRDQAKHLQQGRTLRLGQVMVRNNLLSAAQFMEILEEQEQQILVCPTCGKRYNVKNHESGKKVRCRGCKGVLTVPTDIDEIIQSELIEINSKRGGTSRCEQPRAKRSTISKLVEEVAPETFGRYKILGEVGRGGMGIVYKAHDPEQDRIVAIKVVRKNIARQEEVAARFKREIKALKKLQHPSIIQVHEIGVEQGQAYYTMTFVDGQDLGALFTAGASREEMLEILRKIAEALGKAHAQRIVHRDIKPANILIDQRGVPYLADFGLARDLDAETVLTRPGEIVGTPHYMAPEQILGDERSIGPACDVYALGTLLYQVVTGRLPHAGNSVIELYSQVLEQVPTPPRELCPDLAPALEAVVLKAIEKEPKKRYRSAIELSDALNAALRVPCAFESTSELVAQPGRRRKLIAAAIVIIAFAAGLSLGWIVGRRSRSAAAYLQAAQSSLANGSYRESLLYFDRAIAVHDGPLARQGRAKAHLAIAALETGDAMRIDKPDDAAIKLARFRSLAAKSEAFVETLPLLQLLTLRSATADQPVTIYPVGLSSLRPASKGVSLGRTPVRVRLPRGHYQVSIGEPEAAAIRFPLQLETDASWSVGQLPRSDTHRLVPTSPEDAGRMTPFLISRQEVSAGEYYQYLASLTTTEALQRTPIVSGKRWPLTCPQAEAERPVRGISWHDAMRYALWLGERLPSVREWQRAFGSEDGRSLPWGNSPPFEFRPELGRVGQPSTDLSPYGVQGMAGGVREWCGQPNRQGRAPVMGGGWSAALPLGRYVPREPTGLRSPIIGLRTARSYLSDRVAADADALVARSNHRFSGIRQEALRILVDQHPDSLQTARVLFKQLGGRLTVAMGARHQLSRLDPQLLTAGLVALVGSADAQARKRLQLWADQRGASGAYVLLVLLVHDQRLGEIALETLLDQLGDMAHARIQQALAFASARTRAEIRHKLQIYQGRYFQAARDLYTRGNRRTDRAEIIRLFSRVLTLDPTLKEAYLSRGKMRRNGIDGQRYGKGADLKGALADFLALLSIDSRFVPAMFAVAELHEHQDAHAKALAQARLIERHRKDDPELLFLLGRLQFRLHHHQKAAEKLEQAAARLRNPTRRYNAKQFLAQVWSRLGRHDQAIELARSIARTLKDGESLKLLGAVLARASKKQEAVEIYRQMLDNPRFTRRTQAEVRERLKRLGG